MRLNKVRPFKDGDLYEGITTRSQSIVKMVVVKHNETRFRLARHPKINSYDFWGDPPRDKEELKKHFNIMQAKFIENIYETK